MANIGDVIPESASVQLHNVGEPRFVRQDHRGVLAEIINDGSWKSVLTGQMHRDAVLGNHYHKKTSVYIHLLEGNALIRTVNVMTRRQDAFVLENGSGVLLPPGESHAVRFTEDSTFIMLKSRRYDVRAPDTYPFPVDMT